MAASALAYLDCALHGKGFAHCLHCARRGDDAPGFCIRNTCVAHNVRLLMHSTCTFCVFVQRGALVASITCIECTSAHVFGTRSRAHLHVICAHSLYERSSNCAHQGPTAKCGTKTCPRFGDTILARFARRCKRRRARGIRAARGVCLRWCVRDGLQRVCKVQLVSLRPTRI